MQLKLIPGELVEKANVGDGEAETELAKDKKERIKKIVYEAVEAIATRRFEGDDSKDLQVDSVDFDEYGTLVAKIYGGFNGSIAMHSAYYCTQWAHLIELLGFWGVKAWLVETWIDCLDDVWTLKLGLDTKEN